MRSRIIFLVLIIFTLFFYVATTEDDFDEFKDPEDVSSQQIIADNEKSKFKDILSGNTEESTKQPSEELIKSRENFPAEAQQNIESNKKMDIEGEEVTVETEEEISHLHDSEEFEGFDKEMKKDTGKPDLKIAKVPHHLTTSWENYYLELLMIAGLIVYMANFFKGKAKNFRLANAWFESHKDLLEANFSLVGDDGQPTPVQGVLNKESENHYNLWCSGRVCCEGMLVEIKLLKRQDVLSLISRLMRPMNDYITVKVILDDTDIEGFVMCIANRKRANTLLKEFQDLATFCPDKRSAKSGIPESFVLFSEINEASTAIIDPKVQRIFKDFEDNIEYMHISDQFTGFAHPQDDQTSTARLPEIKKCLLFGFKVGQKGNTNTHHMEAIRPLFNFVLYMIDKVHRVKLSKESKLKSEKNRQKAMDSYEKSIHLQRQEAAQQRKVEKIRQEKEKLMAEEDPDRARKLEKREAKNKQPKMKMLKIKG